MIKQLSIYTENRKGAALKILSLLSSKNINVLGFVNNDSGEFGTVRLILSDNVAARAALADEGYMVKESDVMAIELEDKPGALEGLLKVFDNMNININYMYVGYMREKSTPVIMINSTDMDIVSNTLASKGYAVY